VLNRADTVQVQAWMGHADIKTTQRYLHYKSRVRSSWRPPDRFAGGLPLGVAAAHLPSRAEGAPDEWSRCARARIGRTLLG